MSKSSRYCSTGPRRTKAPEKEVARRRALILKALSNEQICQLAGVGTKGHFIAAVKAARGGTADASQQGVVDYFIAALEWDMVALGAEGNA